MICDLNMFLSILAYMYIIKIFNIPKWLRLHVRSSDTPPTPCSEIYLSSSNINSCSGNVLFAKLAFDGDFFSYSIPTASANSVFSA